MEADRFVFLDETGSNITMTRRYARSKRGHPVYGRVPHRRGKNLTVVGAISASGGLIAHRALDGAMTGAAFLAFATEEMIPVLRPGQVVVMDNLSAHKTKAVRAAFEAAGVGVVYLPRYSPEFNPIELCWAKVKARLRAVGARTRDTLRTAVSEALALVEIGEIRRWVRHCGYRLTST